MAEARGVVVIGGGPAGMAAAAALHAQGWPVTLVEQRDRLGGAIYRQFAGAPAQPHVPLPARHRRHWAALSASVQAAGEGIQTLFESVFIGLDRDGRCLVEDRRAGRVYALRPRALILALGTVEQVVPRPGWELPGVSTAGGMQVQLKETGEAPRGPVLLAGNGPLLLALAAQLTRLGQAPLAVLERGQPFHAMGTQARMTWQALRATAHVREALGYGATLLRARVPYLTGWTVTCVEAEGEGLRVAARHVGGAHKHFAVRHLALHDGLQSNALGVPRAALAGLVVERAGDCREVLGADAAIADGQRVALAVARQLRAADQAAGGASPGQAALDAEVAAQRRIQQVLGTLFQAAPMDIAPDTVICRCEGLRRADLQALPGAGSAKELRLQGRFGMGACQGRFCARSVRELSLALGSPSGPWGAVDMGGDVQRWPLRPVSVASLAAYDASDEGADGPAS